MFNTTLKEMFLLRCAPCGFQNTFSDFYHQSVYSRNLCPLHPFRPASVPADGATPQIIWMAVGAPATAATRASDHISSALRPFSGRGRPGQAWLRFRADPASLARPANCHRRQGLALAWNFRPLCSSEN